jgi:FG-GAP repeat
MVFTRWFAVVLTAAPLAACSGGDTSDSPGTGGDGGSIDAGGGTGGNTGGTGGNTGGTGGGTGGTGGNTGGTGGDTGGTGGNTGGTGGNTGGTDGGTDVDATVQLCGNNQLDDQELCDDGNATTEEACPYGVAQCATCSEDCDEELTLTGNVCGDGVVAPGHEQCDVGPTCHDDCTWFACDQTSSCRYAEQLPQSHNGTFGRRVAMDGDVLAVAAPGSAGDAGVVRSYRKSAGAPVTWTLEQTIVSPSGEQGFGGELALDGNVLAVSFPNDDTDAVEAGSVHVYRHDGTEWKHEARLKSAQPSNWDSFGSHVALEGDRLVVGVPGEGTGATYVFHHDGSAWQQEVRMTAPQANANFGAAVAIQNEWLVVGASTDDESATDGGAVHAYHLVGSTWELASKIAASDPTDDAKFGASLTFAGNTLMVGATGVGDNRGAAYVFELEAGVWQEKQSLRPSLSASDRFGRKIVIEGTRAIIAAKTPAMFVYDYDGSQWFHAADLQPGSHSDPNGFTPSLGDIAISGGEMSVGVSGLWATIGPASTYTGAVFHYH